MSSGNRLKMSNSLQEYQHNQASTSEAFFMVYTTTNGFDTLVSLISLALVIWAIVYTHGAMKRYEEREDAKLRALERIARAIAKNEEGAGREPKLRDTW